LAGAVDYVSPRIETTLVSTLRKPDNELSKLSGEIAWYEEEARKSVSLALQYKLEIGRRLLLAKDLLPHGKFLSWAHQEFGWTPRHIQNHLALAANAKQVARLAPGASLRMALAAIKNAQMKPANGDENSAEEHAVPSVRRRIHVVGEIEEGTLDCQLLVAELSRIAAHLGAPKTRWKAR
jgi:hypothetical protein